MELEQVATTLFQQFERREKEEKRKGKWRLHNCGNTTEANYTTPTIFQRKRKKKRGNGNERGVRNIYIFLARAVFFFFKVSFVVFCLYTLIV